MLGIYAHQIKGLHIQLAPFGTEGDPLPCLVWTDPNPNAEIRHCKVWNAYGKPITAKTARGLSVAARRTGLVVEPMDLYMP